MKPVGEFLHRDREASPEAAKLFKVLAAESEAREEAEESKTVKLWCMKCCVRNEFKEVNSETVEICKKCGKKLLEETKA